MPGLIRGVARTAIVAGTATAVSNRVTRRQRGRWAAQGYDPYGPQQASYAAPPPAPVPPPPPPASGTPDPDMSARIEQLKQLGELKAQGVLTEAEFEQQKQRLLNG
ncbi:SHOCT domain-containing protein [Streptomyces sp. 15-116A]|uniref:SHOCT domain-containing protein n=1 Tax=Streptomyces sp. 15-116A TaxID=2259035 RepID=UPI0021B3B8C6|nr:SHOCT domain-containing protein [Streptomyces sp. 15-116A]MCT7356708.1 SHOCT domain-containing protein [Streptomyces sp. 15-116A]